MSAWHVLSSDIPVHARTPVKLYEPSRAHAQGGGAVGEDRIFRVEPASRKGKKMERMFCADMEHMGESVNHRPTPARIA